MYTLPKDPVMLLSFVNMKLRDEFSSLDELAAACSITADEIKSARRGLWENSSRREALCRHSLRRALCLSMRVCR